MLKEHKRFWNSKDMLVKAERLGMNPVEVYTLASIVEREISKNEEKKRVAGLYLNRIKDGMRLMADLPQNLQLEILKHQEFYINIPALILLSILTYMEVFLRDQSVWHQLRVLMRF